MGNSIIQENATGIGINVSPLAEFQVGKTSDVAIAMSNSNSVTSGNRGSLAWYNSSGSTVANIRAVAVTDNVGTELQFYTRPASGSLTQTMTITSVGNVGIGTTSPTEGKLVVRNDSGNANINIKINDFDGSDYAASLDFSTGGQGANDPQAQIKALGDNNYSAHLIFSTQNQGTTNPLVERMRISSGGNVLIGTTTDTGQKLQVNGNINIIGNNYLDFNNGDSRILNTSGQLSFQTFNSIGPSFSTKMIILGNGNVGIGTTPSYKLDITNSVAATSSLDPITLRLYNGSDGGSAIYFQNSVGGQSKISFGVVSTGAGTDDTYLGFSTGANTTLTERMQITSGGSLQINYNPGGGDVYFRDTTNGAVMFYIIPATYVGTAPFNVNKFLAANSSHISFEAGGSERMRINSGGAIVMGNTTNYSDTRLSTVSEGTTSATYSFIAKNSTPSDLFIVRSDGLVGFPRINDFTTGNSPNTWINPASSYGIYINTSSRRYKKDIVNYDKGLTVVNQLRPVYYKGTSEVDGDKQFAGFIAEEIDELGLTEFVNYLEDGRPNSLSYPNMVVLLTKAIQELKVENDLLKDRLDKNNIN